MEEDLRYPIGRFKLPDSISAEDRDGLIRTIKELPGMLGEAVGGLEAAQIDTPYRPGGWTVRQVVHHIADSHLNAFCRFKLALTEEDPTIRPYFEDRWAELGDSGLPIGASMQLIEGLHGRWGGLLESMTGGNFGRRFKHPESGEWDLAGLLALYDWHSRHHTAHITHLRNRKGW